MFEKQGRFGSSGRGIPLVPVIAAAVALVVGILIGRFVLSGTSATAAFSGKTTVSESELDSTIATYRYNGASGTVSVREAIESQASLDSVKNDDGSYALPSADSALAAARNAIFVQVAQDAGITVTDDELPSYAEQITGSSDFAAIASEYAMTEDQVKEIVRQSAAMSKLQEQVVSSEAAEVPTAPETPADGEDDSANATYGAYIVELLGDEWDSGAGTWARQDGPYYEALKDEVFSADSATYNQAELAYTVAYTQYAESSETASSEWTSYVNSILSSATIELVTLGV